MSPEPPFRGRRLIVGVCGSIAAYKAALLTRLLVRAGAEVRVLMTPAATAFVTPLTLSTLSRHEVLTSVISPEGWNNHVELGLWADAYVIAPATANTLARLAHGLCDDVLAAVYLSARCPVLVAPAMDVDMWQHPSTRDNVARLERHGVTVIPVGEGELASGLSGAGRLAEPEDIVAAIERRLAEHPNASAPDTRDADLSDADTPDADLAGADTPDTDLREADLRDADSQDADTRTAPRPRQPIDTSPEPDTDHDAAPGDRAPDTEPANAGRLAGATVLVTAGPTYEPIDPVRFVGNRSSGKQGLAIVEALLARGARVELVLGPVRLAPKPHPRLRVHAVTTAREMHTACLARWPACTAGILCAAVADYRPAEVAEHKIKKPLASAQSGGDADGITLRLVRNPDIAAELGAAKRADQFLVGFALETENGLANARGKLARKRLDAIVLNVHGPAASAFGGDDNAVTIVGADGDIATHNRAPKRVVAELVAGLLPASARD